MKYVLAVGLSLAGVTLLLWLLANGLVSPGIGGDGKRSTNHEQTAAPVATQQTQDDRSRDLVAGAAAIRFVIEGEHDATLGLRVGCWDMTGAQLWLDGLDESESREVPADTAISVALFANSMIIHRWNELTVPAGTVHVLAIDMVLPGKCRFDLRSVPGAVQEQGIVVQLFDPDKGTMRSWPVIPNSSGCIELLAYPPRASVRLVAGDVRLVARDRSADVFPLQAGAIEVLDLPDSAALILARHGVSRLKKFAVLGAGDPRLTADGCVVLDLKGLSDRCLTVVSESGWGRVYTGQLLPVVENEVDVGLSWIRVGLTFEGRVPADCRLQLAGPVPGDQPLMSHTGDPRIREQPLSEQRCTFYPAVPGRHSIRLKSTEGALSPVVAWITVDESPDQDFRINAGDFQRVTCTINGLGELLTFLGVRFLNDGQGGGIGQDGRLRLWSLGTEITEVTSYETTLPRGIPVISQRLANGDIDANLSPNIAFVSVWAQAQHGGQLLFKRPDRAGSLRTAEGSARFVTVQGDSMPLVVWEQSHAGLTLLGAVTSVPTERYTQYVVDTAGRWVALSFEGAARGIDLHAQLGGVTVSIGEFATLTPARIWLPYTCTALVAVDGDLSWHLSIRRDEEHLTLHL